MSDLLVEVQDGLCLLTLNRVSKHNAFDDKLLIALQQACEDAIKNPVVRVLVLKANGSHFSAGADLAWMQLMASFSEEENVGDALILANLMHTLYLSSKPTLAMVQGCAYGGGAGLVAACDIGIASDSAKFCFSEVRLGLIPAVISPFVVQAVGARSAKALFMSAEVFDAQRALELHLIHYCVPEEALWDKTLEYAQKIVGNAPVAVRDCKQLVHYLSNKPVDKTLMHYTASLIAQKRVGSEGQKGLKAFLRKETPNWD